MLFDKVRCSRHAIEITETALTYGSEVDVSSRERAYLVTSLSIVVPVFYPTLSSEFMKLSQRRGRAADISAISTTFRLWNGTALTRRQTLQHRRWQPVHLVSEPSLLLS
jgi:hypothetical protein